MTPEELAELVQRYEIGMTSPAYIIAKLDGITEAEARERMGGRPVYTNEWSIDDPREAAFSASHIAICVDGRIFGGWVETKHGWCVWLNNCHHSHDFINADAAWPRGWRWVRVPPTGWKP
jgi:hypothetical protein